jgi:hypothetical protein
VTETFTPPVLYTFADLVTVGIAGIGIGVFIAALYFIVARGADL